MRDHRPGRYVEEGQSNPSEHRSRGGPWCGLGLMLLWSPMLVVIPTFPDLDDRGEVIAFWQDHGSFTLGVIASVAAGYPLLLMLLAELATRAAQTESRPVLSWAALISGVMFMTGLNAALGLAAAAGRIVDEGSEFGAAYALHVGSFVLAAPFTGAGVAFFVFVLLLSSRGHLEPRWLRWPALLGILGNVGAIGGLFSSVGPGNSGNGILGGILLPLGTFLTWTVCASVAWLADDPIKRSSVTTRHDRGISALGSDNAQTLSSPASRANDPSPQPEGNQVS